MRGDELLTRFFETTVATRIVWDHYELDKKLGLVGGGGFDFRFDSTPINFALNDLPPKSPRCWTTSRWPWGTSAKLNRSRTPRQRMLKR